MLVKATPSRLLEPAKEARSTLDKMISWQRRESRWSASAESGERRPVGHGDRQRLGLPVADGHAERSAQATHRPRQDLRVQVGGVVDHGLHLLRRVRL